MKKLVIASLMALGFCTSSMATAADLKSGIFELNRGNFKAAMSEFEPLIAEGYAPAQYQVALMHSNGWGMKKNPLKAFELLTLAADQNYPDAQFELAVMYSEGMPIVKDTKKAFELTQKAANKGLASAQFNLGVMYAEGVGTYKDNRKAFRSYEKAANQNYALAQYNLALMHAEGKGTKKNLLQSYVWNTVASFNGYKNAETSRVIDQRNMSTKDIQTGNTQAKSLYTNLVAQAELRAKQSAE